MIRAAAVLIVVLLAGCAHGPGEKRSGREEKPRPTAKTHGEWARESEAAYQRKDYAAAVTATQAALVLRPDSPRYLYNLACAYALMRRPNESIDALRRLAALGVVVPLEQDPDLAAVRRLPAFKQIRIAMHRNGLPHGKVGPMFDLPNRTGIIEGIAHRASTQEYFLSDVRERCVWRSQHDGTITRFTPADPELLGVFKLLLDEPRGLLWASTSALPEMAGYTPAMMGRGALVAFDLNTGKVVRNYPLPTDGRNHCLGDFLVAADGTIYLTDSLAPIVWQLPPKSGQLEAFVEIPGLVSLQGIGLASRGTKLLISDSANGLVAVDLASRRATPVTPPARATLLGIDALMVKGDAVIAVQSGVEPPRVVRVQLSPNLEKATRLDVLASAFPNFNDLAQFVVVDGWLMLVTHSGWADFEKSKGAPPAPHTAQVVTLVVP